MRGATGDATSRTSPARAAVVTSRPSAVPGPTGETAVDGTPLIRTAPPAKGFAAIHVAHARRAGPEIELWQWELDEQIAYFLNTYKIHVLSPSNFFFIIYIPLTISYYVYRLKLKGLNDVLFMIFSWRQKSKTFRYDS